MMKEFEVTIHQLQWRNVLARVEAQSVDDIYDLIESEEYTVLADDFDCCEQSDIEHVNEIKP